MLLLQNGGSLHINASLTLKQMQTVSWQQITKRWFIRIMALVFLGLLAMVLTTIIQDPRLATIQGLTAPLIFFVVLPLFMHSNISRVYKANKKDFADMHYTFDSEKITIKSPNSSGDFGWDTIIKVDETKDFVLLFATQKIAYMLPKVAFANAAQVQEFVAYARGRVEKK